MCRAKSGIAVRVDEQTLKIYTLPGEDSHEAIREHFNLIDDGILSRYQTPVECVPVTGIGPNVEDYDFIFDDHRPNWWTDQMTSEAKAFLVKTFVAELQDNAYNAVNCQLDLHSLTVLPEHCTLTPGGWLDLSSLTVLPEHCTLTPGGWLDLSRSMDKNTRQRIKFML